LNKKFIMNKWFSTPGTLPEEHQECWVRLNYWFGQPFKAVWQGGEDGWKDSVNDIVYPVWSISRWRPVV
jgi:hypothetical protein